MGLLQNGFRDVFGVFRFYGATASNGACPQALVDNYHRTGMQRNLTAGEGISDDKVGVPLGNLAPSAWILPQKPGMISSRTLGISVSSSGNGLMGLPGEATTVFSITTIADILPEDDTPINNVASSSFTISFADTDGQLITSGAGSTSFSIYLNTPALIASLDGEGSTSFSIYANTPILGALAFVECSLSISVSVMADILPLDDTPSNNIASAFFSFEGSIEPYAVGNMSGLTYLSGGAIDEFTVLTRMSFDYMVHLDPIGGTAGTYNPIGTLAVPARYLSDALAIAVENNLTKIKVLSPLTIAAGDDVSGYRIVSDTWQVVTVETGAITTDTEFEKISLYGELCGTWNVLIDCWAYNITNFLGWMRGGSLERVELAPYIDPDPFSLGSSYFDDVVPMYANIPSVLVANTGVSISFTNCTDMVELHEMIVGTVINATLSGGKVTIDSSCTGGNVVLSGVGTYENNSSLVIDYAGLVNNDAPWGAIAADNNAPGTMGNKLNSASAAGDPWTAEIPGTYVDGSAGAMLEKIKKIIKDNQAFILSK